jgi:hypothetical protein
MYSYSNKIRFIGIILFSFLYHPISVDSMRSVFLFHILNDRKIGNITEDYTSLCLNIICNRSFFILKWCQLCSAPSFTQGWKDIGAKTYLFTACSNCYLRFFSKWAGTRYFYPPEIVYCTGRNYWNTQN